MSDDLWREAMEMWLEDDYDPLNDSDEDFVDLDVFIDEDAEDERSQEQILPAT